MLVGTAKGVIVDFLYHFRYIVLKQSDPAMSTYGALISITKKKGAITEQDNALFKKVLGILDMDEFEDLNGEPFSLDFETVSNEPDKYLIKLTSYPSESKAAQDNDLPLAKEIKDILTSTLGDQYSFKASFANW